LGVEIIHKIMISICYAKISIFDSQSFSISQAITNPNLKGRNKHEHQKLADPTLQNHQTKNPKSNRIKPPTPPSTQLLHSCYQNQLPKTLPTIL